MAIRIQRRPQGLPQDLGSPQVPGSKSHAQRAMILAAFLPGRWTLSGVPANQDVDVLQVALEQLGAVFERAAGRLVLTTRPSTSMPRLDLGENGTGLRILSVLLPMLGRSAQLTGQPGLQRRPMDAALDFLSRYDVAVKAEQWPISVGGETVQWPEELHVNAQVTSQVASGVMLGTAVRVALGHPTPRQVYVHQPVSKGYLDVTARVLHDFGFEVSRQHKGDGVLYQVHDFRAPEDQEIQVPPDPSSLCFPLALAAMHGVRWQPAVSGETDPHPDWDFTLYLERLAAANDDEPVDLVGVRDHPDCFPALAVLAATRQGQTRFSAIQTLRAKESDRIHAMAEGLASVGVPVEERHDGLTVFGALNPESTATSIVPTTPDHRVVMALALLGTVLPEGIVLLNEAAVAKSWPGYFDWLRRVAELRDAATLE